MNQEVKSKPISTKTIYFRMRRLINQSNNLDSTELREKFWEKELVDKQKVKDAIDKFIDRSNGVSEALYKELGLE